jgi:hypothetical protein
MTDLPFWGQEVISILRLRYITGRLGTAQGGLSLHLSTLSPDFDALAIDAGFLQQSFEDQVNFTRKFCDIGEGFIIANSYGAYLFLQTLIDRPPLPAKVLLLSPVLGRAMDTERMLFSRPPREKTLRAAIEARRLGMPEQMQIVTGREDEVCDWKLAEKYAAGLNISSSILDGRGHMLDPVIVSRAVDNFLASRPQSGIA